MGGLGPMYPNFGTAHPTPLSQTHIKRGSLVLQLVSQDVEVMTPDGHVSIQNTYRYDNPHEGVNLEMTLTVTGKSLQEADAKMYDKVSRMEGRK